ncbi:MAG: hypothetical protein NTZ48_05690 [Candidatus Omnitrophica bacterium]|nr:hypothetical protein [Candidatus Omnitrophota bacterium]
MTKLEILKEKRIELPNKIVYKLADIKTVCNYIEYKIGSPIPSDRFVAAYYSKRHGDVVAQSASTKRGAIKKLRQYMIDNIVNIKFK